MFFTIFEYLINFFVIGVLYWYNWHSISMQISGKPSITETVLFWPFYMVIALYKFFKEKFS